MVSFVGLATGIDSRQLVSDLMAIERAPLKRLQSQQADLTAATSTLSSFLGAVGAIKTAAATLASASALSGMKASATGSAVVTTVTGTATPASYSVEVLQLAQAQRTRSDAFASSTSPAGKTGTLSIGAGGHATAYIDIAAGDSLTDIATKINGADAHVTASVLYDGSTYRLLVLGGDTGAVAAVTFGGTESLGLAQPGATYLPAQDGRIRLDGQITVERPTNRFEDVLPGVAITARSVTTTAETLTVEADAGAVVEKLRSFVEVYNKARAAGRLAAGSGSVRAANTNLAGDSAIRQTLDALGRCVTSTVSGITGRYDMLAAVGLHSDTEGNLVLDEDAFEAALRTAPAAVAKLFAGDASQGIEGAMAKLGRVVAGLTDAAHGTLELRIDAFGNRIRELEKSEEALAVRLDAYQKQLEGRFAALETLVAQIKAQGDALAGLTGFNFSSSD